MKKKVVIIGAGVSGLSAGILALQEVFEVSVYEANPMAEFSERFKSPYIKAMFKNYFNSNLIALTFVTSYAFYTSNTVAVPKGGGSKAMIERMLTRFNSS